MPGLIRGVARTAVVAGTASAVSGRVHHRQQQRWADQAGPGYQPAPQEAYAAPVAYAPPPPPPAAAAPSPDMDAKIAQLKQLAELRDQGVLSPAEFEVQKAKLLGF